MSYQASRRWTDKLNDELSKHDRGWFNFDKKFSQLEEFIDNYSENHFNTGYGHDAESVCASLVDLYKTLKKVPQQIDQYQKSISFHLRRAKNEGKIAPKSEVLKLGKQSMDYLEDFATNIGNCFAGGLTYHGLDDLINSLDEDSSLENLQKQLYSGLRKNKRGIALLIQLRDYLQQVKDYEIRIVHKLKEDKSPREVIRPLVQIPKSKLRI